MQRQYECTWCKAHYETDVSYAPDLYGRHIIKLYCDCCGTVTYYHDNTLSDSEQEALEVYAKLENKLMPPLVNPSVPSGHQIVKRGGQQAILTEEQVAFLKCYGIMREKAYD